jgi:hypothetical protein
MLLLASAVVHGYSSVTVKKVRKLPARCIKRFLTNKNSQLIFSGIKVVEVNQIRSSLIHLHEHEPFSIEKQDAHLVLGRTDRNWIHVIAINTIFSCNR